MYMEYPIAYYLEADNSLVEFVRVSGHEEYPVSVLGLEGLALGYLLTTKQGAAGEELTDTLNKTDINGKTICEVGGGGRERERENTLCARVILYNVVNPVFLSIPCLYVNVH
jgi:hypothetical protein